MNEHNAVEHYFHLIEQGVEPDKALAHTVQRFGVRRDDLRIRVSGAVARPAEVRRLLASVHSMQRDERKIRSLTLLEDLYEAITGETLVN